ncbi:AAA ATPase [Caldicellulosiruptor hydrothermalis 108]|uniref:AAA ATPase n=1 Tax=Caldicellulosiruptor hydrothermalis (strain DSM 18901 / VKM B-2411 / 108) TaxID=632292 RepID=E4QDN0_CALH1|nr:ATP-binding protein [Caldicellulosiruptor hydrothermalis]ADQ06447.1 AAA ATPase [Caldicellulosiruptor hydrothermalis 108]
MMTNKKEILETIDRIYKQRRYNAELSKERKIRKLCEKSKEFADICDKIKLAGLKLSKASLMENKEQIAKYSKILDTLISKRTKLLIDMGYSSDYLEPDYVCKACHDTGFVVSDDKVEVCKCRTQLFIELLYEQSKLKDILKHHNFDNLNLDFYSKEVDVKEGLSPYKNMLKIVEEAKKFVENFDKPNQKNLLFYGPTGLGKTFLAHCIAKEIIDKGKTVIFLDSISFFEILKDKYSKMLRLYDEVSDEEYKSLEEVDLLIIDDLGNEGKNAEFCHGVFQSLLDKRHLLGKKTVITTNYSLDGLVTVYSQFIMGRLQEYFMFLHLFGEDVRIIKAKLQLEKRTSEIS